MPTMGRREAGSYWPPCTDLEMERHKAAIAEDTELQKEIYKTIAIRRLDRREISTRVKRAEKETPASDTESYFMEDSDTDTETVQEKKHGAKGRETKK